jgi:lysophospholipid acyltransferase (LPLAT)-like uncharacterized protein
MKVDGHEVLRSVVAPALLSQTGKAIECGSMERMQRLQESWFRVLLGFALGLLARVWLATLRVEVEMDPGLAAVACRPWVLAFLHGQQWPLLAWRRRRKTVVLVSLSADGTMQSRALRVLGLEVVRGSSSHGGARGLATLLRRMKREGLDAAIAVDGPRGPRGIAKPGAAFVARRAGAVLVPMEAVVRTGTVLRKTWDHFVLAWPFSRVLVRLGAPVSTPDPP